MLKTVFMVFLMMAPGVSFAAKWTLVSRTHPQTSAEVTALTSSTNPPRCPTRYPSTLSSCSPQGALCRSFYLFRMSSFMIFMNDIYRCQ